MWRVPVVLCALIFGGSHGVKLVFPEGFKFGAATAAYQVEGAWNVSDKGLSIWDTFAHDPNSGISDNATGDVACDSYHLWETDIEIAANLSLDFYRFSIAWSRLLPTGFPNHISEDGKNYYNNVINGLLAKGIEPLVTLYHWDLPQRLQDLGGWTNPLIVDWFADYADVVYQLFGDRVRTWITINEPIVFCDTAYSRSLNLAPGIKEPELAPHLCAKNVLLAHAKAYRLYHEKYGQFQGKVSIANHMLWYEGLTEEFAELGELAMQYSMGRYASPIFSKEGGWPPEVEKLMAEVSKKEGYPFSRLPSFTEEEKKLVKGTYDYYSFNHYTTRLVRPALPGEVVTGYPLGGIPELNVVLEGKPEWRPPETSTWLLQYPEGIRKILSWVKRQYGDIPVLITENGYVTVGGSLEDDDRVKYYRDYLEQVLLSIHEDGVNVIGYTAWTLLDNFEWMDGYRSKFGLYEVDFNDPMRTRTPRKSARHYADVIKNRFIETDQRLRTEL